MCRDNTVMQRLALDYGEKADLYISCLPIARRIRHGHAGLALAQQVDIYDTNKEFFRYLFGEIYRVLWQTWLGKPFRHDAKIIFGCHLCIVDYVVFVCCFSRSR